MKFVAFSSYCEMFTKKAVSMHCESDNSNRDMLVTVLNLLEGDLGPTGGWSQNDKGETQTDWRMFK